MPRYAAAYLAAALILATALSGARAQAYCSASRPQTIKLCTDALPSNRFLTCPAATNDNGTAPATVGVVGTSATVAVDSTAWGGGIFFSAAAAATNAYYGISKTFSGPYTVSTWVYLNNTGTLTNRYMYRFGPVTLTLGRPNASSNMMCVVGQGASTAPSGQSSCAVAYSTNFLFADGTATANGWRHVALAATSIGYSFAVDGVLVASLSTGTGLTPYLPNTSYAFGISMESSSIAVTYINSPVYLTFDFQIYSGDMSAFVSNIYGGSPGAQAFPCFPMLLPSASVQPAGDMAWSNGPPAVITCQSGDRPPLFRYMSGFRESSNPSVGLQFQTNTGSLCESPSGTCYASSTYFSTWSPQNGGATAAPEGAIFTTPGIALPSGMTIAMWVRTTYAGLYPAFLLGQNTYMFVSGNGPFAACVVSATNLTTAHYHSSCANISSTFLSASAVRANSTVNGTWTHVTFTAATTGEVALFINGVLAAYRTSGFDYNTVFAPALGRGMTVNALGSSQPGSVFMGDLQVFDYDMIATGSNLFNGNPCNASRVILTSLANSTQVSMPGLVVQTPGTPFTYSCNDTAPFMRIADGATDTSQSSNITNLLSRNTGRASAPAWTAANLSTTGNLTATPASNAIVTSAQFAVLRTIPYAYRSGITIAFWLNQQVGLSYAPVAVLGNGLYLYASSVYGLCVASGPYNALAAPTSCFTWDAPLFPTPVVPMSGRWTHYTFTASPGRFAFYQNGVMAASAQGSLFSYGALYGSNVQSIGFIGSANQGATSVLDLQVYDFDLGASAPNLYFGNAFCVASNSTYGMPAAQNSTPVRQYRVWPGGPPFVQTCVDVTPKWRLIGTSGAGSTVGLLGVLTFGNTSQPTVGLGNHYLNTSGTVVWTTSQGATGYGMSSSHDAIRTAPTSYGTSPGVTVALWMMYPSTAGSAFVPVATLGGRGLQLYASSTLGLCVVSGSSATIVNSSLTCIALAGASGRYLGVGAPANMTTGAWNHIIFSASNTSQYALSLNGLVVLTGAAGTLDTYAAYYGGHAVALGMSLGANVPGGNPVVVGDLQVYDADFVTTNGAASTYFGGTCRASLSGAFSTVPNDFAVRVLNGAGNGVERTAVSPTLLVSPASYLVATSLLWSGIGFGAIVNSTSHVTLAAADWGTGATGGSGFSASFWVYRTTAPTVSSVVSRLLTVYPTGTASDQRGAVVLGIASQNASATGYAIVASWPGCGNATVTGATFTTPTYSASTLGVPSLNSAAFGGPYTGLHHVAVTFGAAEHVRVYVDGIPWAFAAGTCSLGESSWPSSVPSNATYVGGFLGSMEANATYVLADAALFTRPLGQSEVSAIARTWAFPLAVTPPPPPPYAAPATAALLNRLTACVSTPPSHRYGSTAAFPFTGNTAWDSVGSWHAPYVSITQNTSVLTTDSLVTLPTAGTASLYSTGAVLDLGVRGFQGFGLTVAWLTTNGAGQCAATNTSTGTTYSAIPNAPSSTTYFDFGGFALYSTGTCGGGMTTRMTSPRAAFGEVVGKGNYRNPDVPAMDGAYTVVSIGITGTAVYVNGFVWAVFPGITWVPTSSASVRFWGGNLLATNAPGLALVIHDLQIYDASLTAAEVFSLSRGRGSSC